MAFTGSSVVVVDQPAPSDLAVTFRSLHRRLQAVEANADDPRQVIAARQARREVAVGVGEACRALALAESVDPEADARAVADRIEAIAPAEWNTEVLSTLRRIVASKTAAIRNAERNAD